MATTCQRYKRERHIAELAVQRAAILTEAVYYSQVKQTLTKDDKSPVTLADFGAQALVLAALATAFPDDKYIGEEDSAGLRTNPELSALVFDAVARTLKSNKQGASNINLGTMGSEQEMWDFIDLGNHDATAAGRVWTLDPIDGTKGFLRGGQYAIALALLVDGVVQVGVLGCPHLSSEGEEGIILSAVRGQGVVVKQMSADLNSILHPSEISMSRVPTAEASFCEGVEAGHSAHELQAKIANDLGISKATVRMDSQAKYASIAMGQGEIYLRLPTKMTYEEKIWDHAAGVVIIEEAGGIVVDMYCEPLDFTQGRTLKRNKGVVALPRGIFGDVMEVVTRNALEKYGKSAL
ncbi:hypothetical protein TWF694_005420 [Orbilia ellipsospora]|uniref:3'(2'),5'-bisphosphate nucleotidase n=1 Tax=Orbilia ellipsospora TaxID=2528407 RepID=A0AAV9WV71_9PEZI